MIVTLAAAASAVWFYKPIYKNALTKGETQQTNPASIQDFVNKTFSENRDTPTTPGTKIQNSATAKPSTKKSISSPKTYSYQDICAGTDQSSFDCYESFYTSLVGDFDIKTAMADLRTRYGHDGYAKSQCHPLTHVIGRIGSQKFANVGDAYAQGDSLCWSGYYHGVMEGIIGRVGYNNLVTQLDGICSPLAAQKKYSFDHYNCVHGLGHGIMAIRNDELFESLEICDNLKDAWERASCWSGAFMENIIIDGKNHVTKYLRPSEPLYPCSATGDKYKNTCYLMQTSYMLKVTNGNYVTVFDLCGQVEEAYRATCYQSLGRDVSGRSTSNVAQTNAGCALGRDLEQRRNCIIGAVKDFISYFHSDVQAKELCAAIVEKEVQDVCHSTAESYYRIF